MKMQQTGPHKLSYLRRPMLQGVPVATVSQEGMFIRAGKARLRAPQQPNLILGDLALLGTQTGCGYHPPTHQPALMNPIRFGAAHPLQHVTQVGCMTKSCQDLGNLLRSVLAKGTPSRNRHTGLDPASRSDVG